MKIQSVDVTCRPFFTGESCSSKLLLADDIISHFTPLFNEEIDRKIKVVNVLKTDCDTLSIKIAESKNALQKHQAIMLKKKTINEILITINSLIEYDVLYGVYKQTAMKVIPRIRKLSQKKLDEVLKYFDKLSSKNIVSIIK